MNILALLTDGYGAHGGIAQYNRDLMNALSASPQVRQVACLVRNGTGSAPSSKVHQAPARSGRLRYSLAALFHTLRNKPDVVFCGHLYLVPLAAVIAKGSGARLWVQLHGIDAWRKPGQLTARLLPMAKLVTVVSRYTRTRFLGWSTIGPHRVKVLPNTVSPPPQTPSAPNASERYKRHGGPVMLTVGRLAASERYKGHDRVLRCLPQLLQNEPNLQYLIAGDGDDRQRLELLAQSCGVEENVQFLGKVSDEELDALYRIADLFVMPSTGEGFGIVFLEAMVRGVPALGLDADGSVDPLQDGRLGWVANEASLCETIHRALQKKPAPDLPQRVEQTFGQQRFQQHAHRLMALLANQRVTQ